MNINKIEIDKIKSIIREAQTMIYSDPIGCSKQLEEAIWEIGEVETKHYRTLKNVAEKGLNNE